MRSLFSDSYQIWFPGTLVWELWFVDRGRGARLVDTCADSRLIEFKRGSRRRKILALPSCDQVSLNFVSSATSEVGLLREARAHIESTGPDCDLSGIGAQPVTGYPPETLVRIDIPTTGRRVHDFSENLIPDSVVPAASLIGMPEESVAVWCELRKTVVAVERDGRTAYYEELKGDRDADKAREIRSLVDRLKKEKVITKSPSLYLWDQSRQKVYEAVLPYSVVSSHRAVPANVETALGMTPRRIRENKQIRSARKRHFFKQAATAFGTVALTLLMTGTYAMAYFQKKHQEAGVAANLEETRRLGMIKAQWEEMAPAVDRNASVLETWRKIFTMPSSSEINISRMAIGQHEVEITCEAKSSDIALRYIDELARTSALGAFSWDYTTPEVLLDGTSIFILKGFRS